MLRPACTFLTFLLALAPACLIAADAKDQAAPGMEEMMKKWEEAATPGPAHQVLDDLIGEWNVDSRMWMAGQDGPVTETKGTSKARWILGKRFVQEEFSGEMMGKPFNGVGTTGYDNFRKKYVGTWTDSMTTGIMISEGTASEDKKTLTFTGKMDEPATGEKDKPFKYVIRLVSKDKHTFEMHDLALGEKSKVFEMTYTRKK